MAGVLPGASERDGVRGESEGVRDTVLAARAGADGRGGAAPVGAVRRGRRGARAPAARQGQDVGRAGAGALHRDGRQARRRRQGGVQVVRRQGAPPVVEELTMADYMSKTGSCSF